MVRSLSPGEVRAVAIAEAVSGGVDAVLVEEPLLSLEPRAVPRVALALRELGRAGATVIVTTASVRDAGDLGEDHTLLRAGMAVGHVGSLEALAEFSPAGARVRLQTSDPAALAAALACEAAVDAVARKEGSVVARGRDAAALARAAARAIVAARVEVTQMRFEPPSLDEARAAAAGIAAATYQVALERTRAAARPPAGGEGA
jgi:ABC-2 type transport system ATP-binding protein